MAINKNFVIKNGVEVNTSLIVGDATLNKVGVGTTVPGYTLHVGGSRGGIGATDLTITGIATVGTSGSTSAALSVVGVSSFQGDVNFLGSAGVSTITFDASLDKLNFADNARATFGASDDLQIFHDGSNSIIRETGTGNIVLEGSGETLAVFADDGAVSLYYDDANVFQTTPQGVNVSGVTTSNRLNISGVSTFTSIGSNLIPDGDGSRNIGAAGSEWQDLHIDGTANIDTLAADTAAIGDLTENRVVIAGSSGELEDDANFTFDGSKLNVGSGVATVFVTTGNVAFAGIATVGGALLVGAGVTVGGDILPDADGSRDLGSSSKEFQDLFIDGTANIDTLAADTAAIADLTDNRVVIAGSSGELEDDANLTFDGAKFNVGSGVTIQPHGGVSIAGIVTVGGDLNVVGDITYDEIGGRNINITGFSTFGNDLNVGLTTFFVDVSNGGVGVGTDNPNPNGYGPQFKVFGNNPVLALEDDGGGVNAFGFLRQNSNTLQIVTGDNSDNKIQISKTSDTSSSWTGSNLTNVVTIDQGNIGVGIATATLRDSAKLDVDGDARFSGKVAVRDGGNAGAGVTIFDNGNIAASGIITASTFVGSFSGTVTNATNVTVADESSDTTCFPLFVTDATGDLAPKSGSNLTFNSSTGALTATSFAGNLSGGTVSGTTGTFSGDVDIADKIVHTGDTNTAIRFPAADTITAETGGSEALRVDSSQRLLIGPTSTRSTHGGGNARLQVEGTNTETAGMSITRTSADAGSPTFSFGKTRNGSALSDGDDVGVIYWQGDDGTDLHTALCSIKGEVDGSVSGNAVPGRITFNTATTSTNLTERLRITSTGLIGIGTETPRDSSKLDVDGGARFSGSVIVKDGGNAGAGVTIFDNGNVAVSGIATIGGTLIVRGETTFTTHARWSDNDKAIFGAGDDLQIYHDGSNSIIKDNGTGKLILDTDGTAIEFQKQGLETIATFNTDGAVELYHNNSKKFETTADGVDLSGTGSIKVPVGTTGERPTGQAGDFRYNSTTGSFEGYTDSWGAIAGSGGGASESDTSVSSTSATSIYTTAHATNRSVSAIIQITQGSSYQVGRYLVIHDGTTATIIEESAVATGDMLGTFTADINGSNLRILVNMSSASSATVTILPTVVTV